MSGLTKRCVVARTVDIASSFLILHRSIGSLSIIEYFVAHNDTPLTPNDPSRLLDNDYVSCVGNILIII